MDTLMAGGQLQLETGLASSDGRTELRMQSDGNLALYRTESEVATWSTHTEGKGASVATLQGDGNLVLQRSDGRPVWAADTQGHPGAQLVLQDDGNLVLTAGGTAVWSTNTAGAVDPAEWFDPGRVMRPGDARPSQDGAISLRFQVDHNVVLYRGDRALWSTNTSGSDAERLVLQGDGNLVLMNRVGDPLWASGTDGHGGAGFPVPQDDGNLVIYDADGTALWSTGTNAHIFSGDIITGGEAALGGRVQVHVFPDGAVRWSGHMHDSGADGYDFHLCAVVRPSVGPAIALVHRGSVGGTLTPGSRDHDWDETTPANPAISQFFEQYAGAPFDTYLDYSSDIGEVLESLGNWIIKFSVGILLTPIGLIVFIGVEVGSLITTGSLVPGARVVEGILWMAGPGNTLFALAAAGIASAGSNSRELSRDEYDWANREVFLGSLPDRDQLVLTDTIGADDRAFTFPRFDGKTTLNMGPAAYADPRNDHVADGTRAYGQVFVHELVHACQIESTTMDIALLADAFASKVCEATGGDPYVYGPAGADYTSLNLEQQAQIVSDWFAGAVPAGTNQTGVPKDSASPYFGYLNANVRIGNF